MTFVLRTPAYAFPTIKRKSKFWDPLDRPLQGLERKFLITFLTEIFDLLRMQRLLRVIEYDGQREASEGAISFVYFYIDLSPRIRLTWLAQDFYTLA